MLINQGFMNPGIKVLASFHQQFSTVDSPSKDHWQHQILIGQLPTTAKWCSCLPHSQTHLWHAAESRRFWCSFPTLAHGIYTIEKKLCILFMDKILQQLECMKTQKKWNNLVHQQTLVTGRAKQDQRGLTQDLSVCSGAATNGTQRSSNVQPSHHAFLEFFGGS